MKGTVRILFFFFNGLNGVHVFTWITEQALLLKQPIQKIQFWDLNDTRCYPQRLFLCPAEQIPPVSRACSTDTCVKYALSVNTGDEN